MTAQTHLKLTTCQIAWASGLVLQRRDDVTLLSTFPLPTQRLTSLDEFLAGPLFLCRGQRPRPASRQAGGDAPATWPSPHRAVPVSLGGCNNRLQAGRLKQQTFLSRGLRKMGKFQIRPPADSHGLSLGSVGREKRDRSPVPPSFFKGIDPITTAPLSCLH